jgi:hypothetical protein
MSDEPSLADNLRTIEAARVNSAYETLEGNSLSILRALARFLLTLKLDDTFVLRPTSRPFSNINIESAQDMDDWAFIAHRATANLSTAVKSLADLPVTHDDKEKRRKTFSNCAQNFIRSWSFWLAALEPARESSALAEGLRRNLEQSQQNAHAIQSLLEDAQEAVKKIGAGQHAKAFFDLYKSYSGRAWLALACTVSVATLFVIFVIYSGNHTISIPKDDYSKLAQVIVGKLLGLGVLYYMLVLAARSYRANAHLAAVNRHRATALQIFRTFADSTSDDQTKNAVLLETTRSIYSHTSTGFLSGEDPSSPIQVVEILKALAPNKGQ